MYGKYSPTLGEKWPHSSGNVGKYCLDGASGNGEKAVMTRVPRRGMASTYPQGPAYQMNKC